MRSREVAVRTWSWWRLLDGRSVSGYLSSWIKTAIGLGLSLGSCRAILFGLGVLGRTRGCDSSVRRIAFSAGRVMTPMLPVGNTIRMNHVGTCSHLVSVNRVVGQVELKCAP